jgi:hypothetical protein
MNWVTGIRSGTLHTIARRPLDPRWSQQDLQIMLGHCANGQALGWNDTRAFNAAEAIVIRRKNHGIVWSNEELNRDIAVLLGITRKQHEAE